MVVCIVGLYVKKVYMSLSVSFFFGIICEYILV